MFPYLLSLLAICLFPFVSSSQVVWQQMGSDLLGASAEDLFGVTMALTVDGETVIVGSQYSNGNGADSGGALIFEWDGNDWIQKGNTLNGEAAGDNAGVAVDISDDGNTVIIGAFKNDGSGADAGTAKVYQWNGSNWMQKGADIDGEFAGDHSGVSVALSSDGNTAAIGAYLNDNTAFASGSASVFEWNGSAWAIKGNPVNGEAFGNNSGFSVSLNDNGSRLAVGAYGNDDGGGDAGHTRVHEWNGSAWIQLGADIDGLNGGDKSGWSVCLDGTGNRLIVGEPTNDGTGTDAGQIKAYELITGSWVQVGQAIQGAGASHNFGHRVSISNDGNRIIIGADKSSTTNSYAGEVKVFELIGSTWVQNGQTIYGSSVDDWTGTGVDISGNGTTIAVGTPNHDQSAANQGLVRVYFNCSNFNVDTSIFVSGVTLTANASGYQYQWVDCDNGNSPIPGENAQSFTATSNGNYAVQISDGKCTLMSSCIQIGGIGFKETNTEIKIFPNPTKDFVYVNILNNSDQICYQLCNASGQILTEQSLNADNKIDLPNQCGLYFIKIFTADENLGVHRVLIND